MANIKIVFWTGTGNTETMAEAIAEGIESAGSVAEVVNVADTTADECKDLPYIILGCPAMGNEELEESEFAPFFEELLPSLAGKKVALFGSYSWAEGEWMDTWSQTCLDNNVDLFDGHGLIAFDDPEEEDLAKCRDLGKRFAQAVA
ncbi:flavodoxin [Amygdalobacter indicium]|jgi:hypothetical protein|uniref:Flavodoxin n=1 Tax=Amygdalobacter indicium TaxID=3029272 RepID=A0ABY8C8D7_9FIRM|nr:flavodoxin [Amygdalobacter indicium]WEG33764.1 flavodoxin [Amygdalobacter indicium]WEG35340.1 flavodoxin [Amygdalobacter indicium]